ncbi:MAG: hypothetical protein PVH55_12030 [Desulfobacterales bacterium]|jgi:hypothetical protein
MAKPKVDINKLSQMLRAGKSVKECAKHFNVTASAISQHKRNLHVGVVKNICMENAHRVVEKNLNIIDQLFKINEEANKLLNDLLQKPEIKLKTMTEIRNQLKLQLEIFQTLFDFRAVEAFQQEVLETIKGVDINVRNEIINRLNQRQALYKFLKFD